MTLCCSGCDKVLNDLEMKAKYQRGKKTYCHDCWSEVNG